MLPVNGHNGPSQSEESSSNPSNDMNFDAEDELWPESLDSTPEYEQNGSGIISLDTLSYSSDLGGANQQLQDVGETESLNAMLKEKDNEMSSSALSSLSSLTQDEDEPSSHVTRRHRQQEKVPEKTPNQRHHLPSPPASPTSLSLLTSQTPQTPPNTPNSSTSSYQSQRLETESMVDITTCLQQLEMDAADTSYGVLYSHHQLDMGAVPSTSTQSRSLATQTEGELLELSPAEHQQEELTDSPTQQLEDTAECCTAQPEKEEEKEEEKEGEKEGESERSPTPSEGEPMKKD